MTLISGNKSKCDRHITIVRSSSCNFQHFETRWERKRLWYFRQRYSLESSFERFEFKISFHSETAFFFLKRIAKSLILFKRDSAGSIYRSRFSMRRKNPIRFKPAYNVFDPSTFDPSTFKKHFVSLISSGRSRSNVKYH